VTGENGLIPDAGNLRFYQMDVIVDKQVVMRSSGLAAEDVDDDFTETITPLFKLVPGRAAKSYGIACARMAGVPDCILSRAGAVTRALEAGDSVPCAHAANSVAAGYTRAMEAQVACADVIMSVEDWERDAQPSDLRKVLKCLVSAATPRSAIDAVGSKTPALS
jgi:DNA mismatch repair ATPase MutS